MVISPYLWNIFYNPLGNAVLGDAARERSFQAVLFQFNGLCELQRGHVSYNGVAVLQPSIRVHARRDRSSHRTRGRSFSSNLGR